MIYSMHIALEKAGEFICDQTIGRLNQYLFKKYDGEKLSNCQALVIFTQNNAGMINELSLKLHWQTHTQIVYKEVSSLNEIDRAITSLKSNNISIKGLIFCAHGCSNGFILCKDEFVVNTQPKSNSLGIKNIRVLKHSLSQLEKDAVIIIKSCSTGKINSKGHFCLAQSIASLARERLVIAPAKDVPINGCKFRWNKELPDYTFRIIRKSTCRGLRKTAENIFYFLRFLFPFGDYGTNITVYFKHKLHPTANHIPMP